jgi:hypothetical protein
MGMLASNFGDPMDTDNEPSGGIVAVFADEHINSLYGLCPRNVNLNEGGTYRANKWQRYLLGAWEQSLAFLEEKRRGKTLYVVKNGDAIELDIKRRTNNLVTHNKAIALDMVRTMFDPLVQMADYLFFTRGTRAHVGDLEDEIAADLGAIQDPDTGNYAWARIRAVFEGVKFDISHHTSMGRLPHTEKNAANKLAFLTMWEYMEWKESPPTVVHRNHNHRVSDSGKNFPILAVCGPSFQYPTEYIERLGSGGRLPHIGFTWYEVADGRLVDWDYVLYKPRRSRPWKP